MLPMVACVISLDSPTVMLARKSLNSDLRGSLILPHCGSLQAVVDDEIGDGGWLMMTMATDSPL